MIVSKQEWFERNCNSVVSYSGEVKTRSRIVEESVRKMSVV